MIKIDNIELPDFPLLLAPMEDVSDPPFRALCKENGADVVYTEFISSEGLIRDAAKSVMKLDIYEKERPVGIQIFVSEAFSSRWGQFAAACILGAFPISAIFFSIHKYIVSGLSMGTGAPKDIGKPIRHDQEGRITDAK